MADLVGRASQWLRSTRAGSVILIAGSVIVTLGAVVAAWRTIFPPHYGRVELVAMSVISDPDSVAAFRRRWLGDSSRPDSLPPGARARQARGDWSLPPGKGRFPIIDLKFRNPASAAAFLTRLELIAHRRPPGPYYSVQVCGVTYPSWEYNVLLDPQQPEQRISVDLSEAVPGSGVDRFVVVVGTRSNEVVTPYDVDLTAIYNRRERLHLGSFALMMHTASCADVHALPNVRRLTSKP